jgi:putative ABC transport system permease protein
VTAVAFRNLWVRRIRTLLTTGGIVLGVAVILAISVTNASTLRSITSVFDEASGKAHLVVLARAEGDGFDDHLLARAEAVAGVEDAIPSVQALTLPAAAATEWQITLSIAAGSSQHLRVYGIVPQRDQLARTYQIRAGRFLDDTNAHELVLVDDYAKEQHIDVGDDVEMLVADGAQRLRVVGLMTRDGPGRINSGRFGVMPLEAAQALFGRAGRLDQLDIVAESQVAGAVDRLEALKGELQARLGDEVVVMYPESRGEVISRVLATYQRGLGFFSATALFVGGFLIYNAFSMTVAERTRELGMLRALGATRGQILRLLLVEALMLGALGTGTGMLFGYLLAQSLTRLMGSIVSADLRVTGLPPSGLVMAAVVGIVVTLLSALWPAVQASRVSPLQAIRARATANEGRLVREGWVVGSGLVVAAFGLLYVLPVRRQAEYYVGVTSVLLLFLGATLIVPKTIRVWQRLLQPLLRIYGPQGAIGGGNVVRARARTAVTVAALMVGLAMILGIRAMTASFKTDLGAWVDSAIGGDLYVRSPVGMRPEFEHQLKDVPGIGPVAPLAFLDTDAYFRTQPLDRPLVLVALEPSSYTQVSQFMFDQGQDGQAAVERLSRGEAVLISTVVAQRYGVSAGDELELVTSRGRRPFYVAGVIVDFTFQGYVTYCTLDDARRLWNVRRLSTLSADLQPGEDPEVVRQRILDRYGDSQHVVVETSAEFKGRIDALTSQSFGLFDVLALIGVVIAALGVINTLTMNVLERTREIGMLRSLGMVRRQVGQMVLAEAGMMGLIGGVFGLLFGLVLSRVFVRGINQMSDYGIDYVFPTEGVVISVVIALVVSQTSALYPAWRAARVKIIEALAHE